MRKQYFILPFLLFLLLSGTLLAQVPVISNWSQPAPAKATLQAASMAGSAKAAAPSACGVDTVEYPLNKATQARALVLNSNTSAEGVSQYFDAPQAITVHGFEFYSWVSAAGNATITTFCEIYLAGPDSLPTGLPLAADTLVIDTTLGNGSLDALRKIAVFNTPVTVSQPYVMVVRNPSSANLAVVFNNWETADGQFEWLMGLDFGSWDHSYNVTLGGFPANCDVLFSPFCSYTLRSDFLASPVCLKSPNTTVNFINQSSPVLSNRMYNVAAFLGQTGLSYTWDFGDASNTVNAVDTFHTYGSTGPFLANLNDTLFGWNNFCTSDTSILLRQSPLAGFNFTNSGLSANFLDAHTGGTATSWFWDFGDGSTSTAQNPSHSYASGGTYTVCQIVSDGNCTDTTCAPITVGAVAATTCGPDTVQYALAKATGLVLIDVNNVSSASGAAQYFDAPQAITVSGFRFYGFSTTLPVVNVTAELYLAGTDSTPTGTPLASTTVAVDSAFGGGSLAVLSKFAAFSTPVTVSAPYVIVISNNSANNVQLVFNDYTTGDGGGEFLSSFFISPNWLRSYAINVGGSVADMDNLFEPVVFYENVASYSKNVTCLTQPGQLVSFLNNSSPIIGNRMYNQAAFFGQPELSYTWNFGDGSPQVNAVDTTHAYSTPGAYTVTLTDTIFGWTSICADDTSMGLLAGPTSNFSFAQSGLQASFTDLSLGSPSNWSWDFGDGSTSTAQNPSHTYSSSGVYTVCLVVSNGSCSDTSCQVLGVGLTTPGCGPDTVQYTLAKASGLIVLGVNGVASASAIGQYYDAPQPITVYGYEFFAQATQAPITNATCEIYLAGPDSLATGSPLASVVVPVDSNFGGGSLDSLRYYAAFPVPVTLNQPYVLVLSNSSSANINLVFNDYTSGDGGQEWLSSYNFGGPWFPGYTVNIGGSPADMDAIMQAVVGYDLTADFSFTPGCLTNPGETATFTNLSSPILNNRMYNSLAFFGDSRLSHTWNFGDGTGDQNAIDTTHVYSAVGTYSVSLTDTIFGWTSFCTADTQQTIGGVPTAAFSSSLSGLTASFTDASTNASSWFWDFGDGSTSTQQNPSHTYGTAGSYTVCLVASAGACADTTCSGLLALSGASCGPDTVQYTIAKATGLTILDVNNVSSAQQVSQYFNVPQPLTIYGFQFFGFSAQPTQNVTCELYLAGADSMPTGLPLATSTVTVDSTFGGGSLAVLSNIANFSPAVTVTQPYVLVLSNLNANSVSLVFSDYNANDGAGEFLTSYDLSGTFTRSYNVNVGGAVADMDALFYPFVTHNLNASFASSPNCLTGSTPTVTVTNQSSAILGDRMYNQAAFFGQERLSYTWNFGDGTGDQNAVDTTHTYAASGTYTVTLTDTLFGWTSFCTADTSAQLVPGPGADFSATPSGLTVAFGDLSSGTPTSWAWDFGDGSTSTLQNPSHTYASVGSYTVCLTVSNGACTDTLCKNVTLLAPATCGPDTVQYTVAKATGLRFLSVNNATSAQSISQYYDAPQAITVYGYQFFAVSDQPTQNVTCQLFLAGTDSMPTGLPLSTANVLIDSAVGGGTLAEFTYVANFPSPVTVSAPYVLVFSNLDANNVSLVFSDYLTNDGAGEFLTSYDLFGTWTRSYNVNVGGSVADMDALLYPIVTHDLSAAFSSNPGCIGAPNTTVNFTNQSSPILGNRMYNQAVFIGQEQLSYTWNFGDGSPQVNAIDTSHTYGPVNNYTVTLTDTLFGWTSICTVDSSFTLATPGITAAFTASSSSLTATFTDATTGNPLSWLWDFGDGNTSTQQNPSHTYAAPGTYTVCLTAADSCGSDSVCQSIIITCGNPVAGFTSSSNLFTANFTNTTTSTGTTTYLWDFGDGNTSTQTNPAHTYAAAGTYTVCLTASDICGTDSTCQSLVITCPPPAAAFTSTSNLYTASFTDASTSSNSITGWLWDFGDGNTSTQQNPSHTYAAVGTYTVCLTVTDSCSSDSSCQSVTITCPPPAAAFTSTSNLFTASFTDASTSSNSITGWLWDFGDGNTSTQQNPSHTYAAAGTYTVCLTVTDSCNSDSSCQSVTITCPPPAAAFTSTSNLYTASFADVSTSSNTITGWLWDFGDGNTSTQQNPSHTYAAVGTYTVCLTVTDACSSDSSCQSVTITCPPPAASFSSSSTLFTASFTDGSTSSNSITGWLWDFGDGNTSTQQNPSHTYAAAGSYTVCLTVTDSCNTDSTCQSVVITCPPPTAAFTSSSNLLTATFTDVSTSSNTITNWIWSFGDGSTSTQQNPTHTYATGGSYTVCLLVTDACGQDSSCQTVVITCPPPVAAFSNTSTLLTANFSDLSTSSNTISSWSWDFGDGNTSTQQNPSHVYSAAGSYTVCLTVSDSCSSDTTCQTVVITCPPPVAAFSSSSNLFTATFTDQSTSSNTIANWFWDFGDGTTSTQQNPTHTYTSTGVYTVCLVVSDTCGQDTTCQSITITCPPPVAAFNSSSNLLTASFTDASTSSNTIGNWFWDFGDGTTSTQQNPTHVYGSAGTYTVCLTVSDSCSSDTVCQSVVITCAPPTAAFSESSNLLTASFTDLSTASSGIISWNWDFGDGNTSTQQNPSHTYAAAGSYTVCLTVMDTCGSDTICQSVTITCPPPSAAFTSTDSGLVVSFFDASTGAGINNWTWSFGDGNSSTAQDPVHTYQLPGTYQVCLTVDDSCGSDKFCDTLVVDTLVGIQTDLSRFIQVFPNPTRNKIYVDFELDSRQDLRIDVISLLGRELRSLQISGARKDKVELDLSDLSDGMYLIRISSPKGRMVERINLIR